MEGESQPKQYELRSRSRSRSETPQALIQSVIENEGSEIHYDLRNRSKERSMTPGEVSSSRRSTSKSLPSSVVKARNKNMETISEKNDTISTENISEMQRNSSRKLSTTSKNTRKTERRSERQRVKRHFGNGQSEVKDDFLDLKSETLEKKRDSSLNPKKIRTSDYSSEEGDREDPPSRPGSAYEFYKQQGEYWNKFPKTDYTYSLASTCRYEVAPGVMAIPNMSRRSLHSNNSFFSSQGSNSQSLSHSSKESFNEDNSTMDVDEIHRDISDAVPQVLAHIRGSGTAGQSVIYKRTQIERHTTRREIIYNNAEDNPNNEKYRQWASPLLKYNSVNNCRFTNNLDSDIELDEAITSSNNNKYQLRNTRTFNKFTRLVWMWFYSILHFITLGQLKRSQFYTSQGYRRYEGTKWNWFRRQIISIMQWTYLLLVKILLFDSWLLSRVSNIREQIQRRRSKLFWLMFLPIILTIVCWFVPYILSAIPLFFKQFVFQFEEKALTPTVHNYVHDLKSDKELRNILDGLVGRIQHLEATKAEHMEQLSNVTQLLQELKQSDSNMWRHYDEKLINLEQEINDQNSNSDNCKLEDLNYLKVEFKALKQLYNQLKNCCDTVSYTDSEDEIQKQVNKVFLNYFGSDLSKEDILRVFQIMNTKIQQNDFQKSIITKSYNQELNENADLTEVRKIVLDILKIYDADKTGQVDYALESAGGQVISTRCTQHYNIHTRAFKILGLTIYNESNNPRTVIQGNTLQPGMCWSFQDFPGYLLIKLRSLIYVTGFTIEHAPKSNLPNGKMKSAPKKFNVWGLKEEHDMEPVLFGEYEFLDTDESLQYFPIQNTAITSPYEFVEIRIHSNHGQLEYTCLYRFRVHGKLA